MAIGGGGFRNISVLITGNALPLQTQLRAAQAEINSFERKVDTSNRGIASSFAGMGKAIGAVGIAVGVALAGAIASAVPFEQSMRNVNSLVHMNEGAFQSMSDKVVDMSTKLPQSANTLAKGLYDIVSSGFQGAAALEILEVSAKAASAGLSDAATASHAIVSVLNAYGLEAKDATDVSDVLFQTVNLGVLTFEELSLQLGDVIGLAAQAHIPIEEIGAAMATITLAGIDAAQASTSLNRVIQSLIDPSDTMRLTFKELGFASGQAALDTLGLHGTMKLLGQSVGGNVESMMLLFPEIRAARGAMALLSNEGANYDRVARGIIDANVRQGATSRALAEQQKSVAFQFTILKNQVMAGVINIGRDLLPMVAQAMGIAREAGELLISTVQDIGDAAGPGIHALAEAVKSLTQHYINAFNAARPFFSLLAGLTLGIAITAFNGLAKAVEVFYDILDTPIIGDFAGAILTAVIAVGIFRAAMGTALVQSAITGIGTLITNFGYLSTSIATANATFGTSMTTWGVLARGAGTAIVSFLTNPVVAATIAIAGLAFVYNRLSTATDEATAAGRRQAHQFAERLDQSSFTARIDAEQELAGKIEATRLEYNLLLEDSTRGTNALTDRISGFGDAVDATKKMIQGIGEVGGKDPFGEWDVDKKKGELAGLREELAKLQERQRNWTDNVKQVGAAWIAAGADVTTVVQTMPSQFDKIADSLGVNLSDSGEKGRTAVKKVAEELMSTAQQAGFSSDTLSTALKIPVEQLEEMAEKTKKVKEAFAQAGDVIGAFGEGTAVSAGDVLKFYNDAVSQATDFAGNIQKALAMGYDTGLIARLLEAGPKQAGPLLDVLVNQMDATGVKIVNDSEKALTKISGIAVQLARITQMAMNAATPEIAADAELAGKLMMEGFKRGREGGKLTFQEASDILGGPEIATRVGQEYGITFAGSVEQAVALSNPAQVKIETDAAQKKIEEVVSNMKGLTGVEHNAIVTTIMNPESTMDDLLALKQRLDLTDKQFNSVVLLWGIEKARTDLDGYLTQLGFTPERKATLMEALNTAVAKNDVTVLQEAYGLTKPQIATLFFTLGTPQSIAEAGQVDANIRKVPQYWESLFAAMGVPEGSEQARLMREAVMGVPKDWYTTFHLSAEARQVYAFAAEHGIDPNLIIAGAVRAGASGMILTMASGGRITGRGQPMIQSGRGAGVQWAEAQTGEEAYIPREGNPARSMALLEQVAQWFGMALVPARGMAEGGTAGKPGEKRGGDKMGTEWAGEIVEAAQQLGPQVREAMQDMTQRAVPELNTFGIQTNAQMQASTGQMTNTVRNAMGSILQTTQTVMPQVEGTMASSQLRTLGTTTQLQGQQEFAVATSQLRMLANTRSTQFQQEQTIGASMVTVVNTMTTGAGTAADNFVNQLLVRVPPLTNTLATYAAQVKQYGNDYMASIGVSTRFARTGALWDLADPKRDQIAPDGAMRVFAEQGTGGEAFIPKYGAKDPFGVLSTAASWYGMRVMPFQEGGLALEELFFDPAGGPYRIGGHADHVHAGAIAGQTWQMIQAFLVGHGVNAVPTSTTGGGHVSGSLHYQGRAVDYGDAVNNVWQVFNALVGLAGGVSSFMASLPMPAVPGAPDFGLGVPAGGPISGPGQAFAMAQLMQLATQKRLEDIRTVQMQQMMATGGGTSSGGSEEAKAYARSNLAGYGWGMDQWAPLLELWSRESGWDPNARNPTSGAAGIPQDITGNTHGGYIGQVDWGMSYIAQRYGSPAAALAFHNAHNWYRRGGIESFYSGGFYKDPATGKLIPRNDQYDVTGKDPLGLNLNTSFNTWDPWMGVDAGTLWNIHENPDAARAWFGAPEENRLAMMYGGTPETWRNILDHPDDAAKWFGASDADRAALMGSGALGFGAGAGEFTAGTDPFSDESALARLYGASEFDRNNLLDPHRGESGYVQAEDGSWVPLSFYGGRRRGGVTADDGTTLAPGWNMRYNATGAPETLRPTRGGGGGGTTVHVDLGGMHIQGLVDADSSQFKKQVDAITTQTARKVAQAVKRSVAE